MGSRIIFLLSLLAGCVNSAENYTGPRPPKPDVPYLLHASTLVETEAGEAREQGRKNETAYLISGTSSPVRTPLSEPIFIMESRKLSPERMELYRLDVRNGGREVLLSPKRRKGAGHPLHLIVTKLSHRLC